MEDRNPGILRCSWPGCFNRIWVERNLEICGGHARQVFDGMTREVNEKVAQRQKTNPLSRTIDQQKEEIHRLKNHIRQLQTPTPRRQPKNGTVYILRCGGFIKIGWTSDLVNRMKSYQPDSVLLATMPGTRADEAKLHKKFAHLRTHGREWYPLAAQITEHVGVLVREHGEPDPVGFAAKPVTIPQPRPKTYVGGNYRGNGLIGERRL